MHKKCSVLKEVNTTYSDSSKPSASNDLLSVRCRKCKGWGAQGMVGYVQELTGDFRTCMIDMFGDNETMKRPPMFRLNITFGGGRGTVQTHGDFGCRHFNPKFEDR